MTLSKAINLVQKKEVVRKQHNLISSSVFTGSNVDVLNDKRQARPKQEQQSGFRKEKQAKATPREVFLKSDKKNVIDVLILFTKESTVQQAILNAIRVEKQEIGKRLSEVSGEIFPIYSADNSDDILYKKKLRNFCTQSKERFAQR